MQTQEEFYISTDQLKIGLYIYLDLKWFEHPFTLSNFKIKDAQQINIIQNLGLSRVRYDPARSDLDLPAGEQENDTQEISPDPGVKEHPALAAKRALIDKIKLQRESAARIETAFVDTARTIHSVEKTLLNNPAEAVEQANRMVAQIADSILSAPDLAIHVMADKVGGENMYSHSLNVTMLSLMVARDLKLPYETFHNLGMGALFHDVGRREIPARILQKTEPLTQVERNYFELHCQYGAEIGHTLKFSQAMLSIIHEHHEMYDGSGYPQGIIGESINYLARIVAITNSYDELCNPPNILNALTPHEALSNMFARSRSRYDPTLLQVFVHCLGVYPPGTIVQLSNGVIGMVVTVNTGRPMKPVVTVYNAEISSKDEVLVDLSTGTEVNITKAIRPAQLPRNIFNYLNPRKRVSYYFDAGPPNKDAEKP